MAPSLFQNSTTKLGLPESFHRQTQWHELPFPVWTLTIKQPPIPDQISSNLLDSR